MRRLTSLICSLVLLSATLVACEKVEPEIANYRKQTKQFQKVTLTELQTKIKAESDSLVYIGRENCPFCVKLVPELLDLEDKLKVQFYYLDVFKTDDAMDKFFDDNKLEYVPSLLQVGHGKVHNIPLDYNYVKKNGSYNSAELKKQLEAIVDKTPRVSEQK